VADKPTLLVVDDEVRILAALKRTLRREGYRILTAETPAQALRMLDDEPIDCILSDQKMPGMSGIELLEEAGRRRPGAARLLITGWTEEVPSEQRRRIGLSALIAKPWDDAELKQILRDALGGS
jgi:response regulator RpfG family c-di-GMP phosphodiesterase